MTYLFLLTTLSCFVELFASIIIKIAISWYYRESNEDGTLHKELIAVKKEMSNVSMVDEFAKYAKLQRKYNKLEEKAKEKLNEKLASRMKLRLSLTYGIRILNGIFTSVLLILYRKEPVIVFPKGYLWPLEKILSWPTAVENCISLPTWIVLTELTVLSRHRFSIS